jgi:hypothetical protein
MRAAAILVEGQTEEAVVQDVLAPWFMERGCCLTPVILKTKRPAGQPSHRGGIARYGKVERDLRLLLASSHYVFVTSLIDFYGWPADAPGVATCPGGSPRGRVEFLERASGGAVGDSRFVPHLTLHELEAWALAGTEVIGELAGDPAVAKALSEVVEAAGGPEEVNDGPDTAPSKRIRGVYPRYSKALDVTLVISYIGVAGLRRSCPHADAWLAELEARLVRRG